MKEIIVKITSLEEALKVYPKITEFDRPEYAKVDFCEKRINGKDNIILAAYVNNIIAGYLIGYDKDNDNNFYCWLAAVAPEYRRLGILAQMMKQFEDYAKAHNYKKVTVKTVNDKRGMLNYLVKNNWNFIEVIKSDKVLHNEIILEKNL